MLRSIYFLLLLFIFTPRLSLLAQVPGGGIQLNASSGTTWQKIGNCDISSVAVEGQSFSEAISVTTATGLNNSWDAQVRFPAVEGIESGDVILVAFWARTSSSEEETGEGFLNVVIELKQSPYTKEMYHSMSIGNEWREYYARAVVQNARSSGEVSYLFHIGFESQTVEIAEVRYLNYKQTLDLEDLPQTETTYGGQHPEAAWRSAADERIRLYRKGQMKITVVDAKGDPVPGALVEIDMQQHAFGFGTAVVASRIVNEKTYRDTLFSMFNEAVFENDLKWPQFENLERRANIKPALDSLDAHGFETRGHNIIWPEWKYMPSDIEKLKDSPEHLRAAIDKHFDEVVAFAKGRLNDWDVMNEPYTNHAVQDILGDEVMGDWYTRPLNIDRGTKLYINDYSIISGGGKNTAKQDYYYQLIQDIESWGGTIDGIGMQGHFATELTSIEKVYEILERFATLGKDIKITEFDINTDQRGVQAEYTRDFMTILFSHPSVKSILTWGFWAGSHWKPEAAFYDEDWNIRPHGEMWREMIYNSWWTPGMSGSSDASGKYSFEGFLGSYTYRITSGDSTRTGTFELDLNNYSAATDSLTISMAGGIVEELHILPSVEGFICSDQEIELSVAWMEGFSYAWTLDGNLLDADSSVIRAGSAGSYVVRASRDGLILESAPYVLEVRQRPEVEIAFEGSGRFCPGDFGTLYVSSGDTGDYEWYRGPQRVRIGGDTLRSEYAGVYHLQVSRDGCSTRSNELTLVSLESGDSECTVGLETGSLETSRVYPNPAPGLVRVEIPDGQSGAELLLYDVAGRLLLSTKLEEGRIRHSISLPDSGIYVLKIRSRREEVTHRVLSL